MAKVLTAKDVVERREDLSERDPEPLLVLEPLAEFLDAHGLGSGPIRAESIGDGHSFETFLLRRDELELVLRRPPRPPYNEGWLAAHMAVGVENGEITIEPGATFEVPNLGTITINEGNAINTQSALTTFDESNIDEFDF